LKKITAKIFLLAGVLFIASIMPQSVIGKKDSDVIVVGGVSDCPPFTFKSENGKADGFVTELTDLLFSLMKKKYSIVLAERQTIEKSFNEGKIDLLIDMTGEDTSNGKMNTRAFLMMEQAVFIRKDDKRIKEKSDLDGKEIITVKNSDIQSDLKEAGIRASIIEVSSVEEALILLASGKHDCAIVLKARAMPVINKKLLFNITSLPEPLTINEICYSVRGGDRKLISELNKGISILLASNSYKIIYSKWYGFTHDERQKETALSDYIYLLCFLMGIITLTMAYLLLKQRRNNKKRIEEFKKELADRKHIENIFAEREELLKQASKIANLGNWIWDSNANVLICSPEAFRILGVTDRFDTLSIDEFYSFIHSDDREKVKQEVQKSFLQKTNFETEYRVIHPNGEIKYIRAKAEFSFDMGKSVRMTGVMLDVTEYKSAMLRVEYANRLYSFLSQITEAIVLYPSIEKIYDGVCKLGVETGKFELVWIGTVDDKTGNVKVESFAGKGDGLINKHTFSIKDNHMGQSTVGHAFRNDSYFYYNDLTRFAETEIICREAFKLGFRSAASFVLHREKKKSAIISFYSKELNFFTENEINLLREISESVSFAIDSFEKENVKKITRRAIQESREKYLSVFNAVSDPIFLIDQKTGNILDVNNAASRFYFYTYEEFLNLKIMDVSAEPEATQSTLTENVEMITSRLHKRKDGTIFPVEVIASFFEQNNRRFYVAVIRDLTESIKSREKLIESEKRYSSLFQKNRAIMIVFDAETGSFVDVNPAACGYYGYSKEQFLKMTVADINILSTEECLKEIGKLARNESSHLYMQHRLANGDIRDVEAFTGLMQILEKQVYYSIIYDITERRKAELELIAAKEKAEEASRLKTSLLGNMSHELRTPLTGILGFSQILAEEITDEFMQEMVDKILRSGKRLMSTLNSILNISELESSKLDYSLAELNLAYSVKERLYEFEKLASEKKLNFSLLELDKNIYIYSDENFLTQIIESLVDNAIKYTEIGGVEIIVDSENDDGKIWGVIKVSDTGIGIPPHLHELIFEEFRQASEGFNRSFEGSGLGLTLAKKMITLLGGTISLESGLGKGSTFTVRLPGYLEIANNDLDLSFPGNELENKLDFSSDEPSFIVDTEVPEKNLPLLLLVEDNYINSDVTIMFLRGICKVDHAIDAENAINMASLNKYDAILMDINLGGKMNGIEALHEIRNIPGYKNTPIIALTGYAMSGDKDRLMKEGFDNYMAKPFEKDDIISLVKLILR